MTTTESTVQLDARLYTYVRAAAMPNTLVALVELLHNSLDVFKSTNHQTGTINITYDVPGKRLLIRDNGAGVAPDRMIDCFGVVGKYTATEGSRGFFSRGASDCSALGRVTFTSVHVDGNTELVLDDKTYTLTNNVDNEITKTLPSTTGFVVSLDVTSASSMSTASTITDIGKHFSLRHSLTLAHAVNLTIVNTDGTVTGVDVLQSTRDFIALDDDDTMLEDLTLKLKSGRTARLKIYRLDKQESLAVNPTIQRYGVLIRSRFATHEITTIHPNLVAHPMIGRVRATLTMNFIEDEMEAFDDGLASIPIIDHSRTTGVNRYHADVSDVFALTYKVLLYHMDVLREQLEATMNVTEADLENLFSSIPEIDDLMRTAAVKTGVSASTKDVLAVINRLADGNDVNVDDNGDDTKNEESPTLEPLPPASVLNGNNPLVATHDNSVDSLNLIVRVINDDEDEEVQHRSCTHSWNMIDNRFIITIDGSCHEISSSKLDVTQPDASVRTILSMLCADVVISFVQAKKVSTMAATSAQELLVLLQALHDKYHDRLTKLINQHLEQNGFSFV
jgi:hypothetical protein